MKKICRRCGKTTNSRVLVQLLYFNVSSERQLPATAFLCKSCQEEIFNKYFDLANDTCPFEHKNEGGTDNA